MKNPISCRISLSFLRAPRRSITDEPVKKIKMLVKLGLTKISVTSSHCALI